MADRGAAWWEGIEPAVVRDCHLVGARKDRERGELRITPAGLEYTGATRTTIPWSDITAITVEDHADHKQISARILSEGVLGLASKKNAAATAVRIEAGFSSDSFTTTQPVEHVQRVMSRVLEQLEASHDPLMAPPIDNPRDRR